MPSLIRVRGPLLRDHLTTLQYPLLRRNQLRTITAAMTWTIRSGEKKSVTPHRLNALSGTNMHLRSRAMQPGDIRECAGIVASHSVIGPRYGPMIAHLPEALLRLFQCEAKAANVVYDGEDSIVSIYFFCVTVMVRDDLVAEMKRSPHFWVGPELTRRIVAGESPLLASKQLREANSRNGLNMVGWEACVHPNMKMTAASNVTNFDPHAVTRLQILGAQ